MNAPRRASEQESPRQFPWVYSVLPGRRSVTARTLGEAWHWVRATEHKVVVADEERRLRPVDASSSRRITWRMKEQSTQTRQATHSSTYPSVHSLLRTANQDVDGDLEFWRPVDRVVHDDDGFHGLFMERRLPAPFERAGTVISRQSHRPDSTLVKRSYLWS